MSWASLHIFCPRHHFGLMEQETDFGGMGQADFPIGQKGTLHFQHLE